MQLTRIEVLLNEMSSSMLTPRLLVIDNIAAPFKLISKISFDKRAKIIDKLVHDLRKFSVRHNCAIFTVNQLTRKRITISDSESQSKSQYQFIPMLGQSWRNHLDSSIYLSGDCEKGRYF